MRLHIENELACFIRFLKRKRVKHKLLSPFYYVKSIAERLRQNKYDMSTLQNANKVILFILPERSFKSGGVISIVNLCVTTRALITDAEVILATFQSFETYSKIDWFENNENIYRFSHIVTENFNPDELYIHIPEYLSGMFESGLKEEQKAILKRISHLHINILNQNILLMPEYDAIQRLFSLTQEITQTTAHDRYANQQICDRWKMPLHHFSAVLPEPTRERPLPSFEEKSSKRLVVFSPDCHPYRERIHEVVSREFAGCTIKTVKNLTYSEYFLLISEAMFVVTFGEGFDAYFTQPFFVGTIGISVFNPTFFPSSEWKDLENVFESYDEALKTIAQKMNKFSACENIYSEILIKNKAMIESVYSNSMFEDNILRFYQKKYDFVPLQ